MKRTLTKLRHILDREGWGGVFGRVRNTPLHAFRKAPPVPQLGAAVEVIDHGFPVIAAEVRRMLATVEIEHGDTVASGPRIERWHVGLPVEAVTATDLVMLPSGPLPAAALHAGLVVSSSVEKLDALSTRPLGRPYYLAGPSTDMTGPTLEQAIARILVFLRALPLDMTFDQLSGEHTERMICLSLPEYPARRETFARSALGRESRLVDGIRMVPGWIGAGASYRALARGALAHGRSALPPPELTICQDDVAPAPDFAKAWPIIQTYVRGSDADLFSGIITDIDDEFRVTRVTRQNGLCFVHLNKSIGLVFNIYRKKALERLATWSPPDDGNILTIDRHLGAERLDVVTTLPFAVHHRGGVSSSIWQFRNERYDSLIAYSERRLGRMVDAFEKGG